MALPPPDAIAGVALAAVAAPALVYVGATAVAVIVDAAAGSLAGSVAVNAPAIAASTAIVAEAVTAIGSNGGAPGPTYVAGGRFSPATKEIAAVRAGKACEYCGVKTTPAQKSMSGVTPPKTEAQTDHIIPRSQGGTNSPNNAAHACRECNRNNSNDPKPHPREDLNKK